MEKLCETLGRKVLVSAQFVGAGRDCAGRLEPLGRFTLRGVGEPKEIFGLVAERGVGEYAPRSKPELTLGASL